MVWNIKICPTFRAQGEEIPVACVQQVPSCNTYCKANANHAYPEIPKSVVRPSFVRLHASEQHTKSRPNFPRNASDARGTERPAFLLNSDKYINDCAKT